MPQRTYIWQADNWPRFTYQEQVLQPLLDKALLLQTQLVGCGDDLTEGLDRQAEMDALIQSALQTSLIEGEVLNVGSVRSSVVKKLGLDQAGMTYSPQAATKQTESLVAMLCEATSDVGIDISIAQLCQWQAALFLEPSVLKTTMVGELRGNEPMQVVSQKRGRETVHFEAPPRVKLETEMSDFLDWFNTSDGGSADVGRTISNSLNINQNSRALIRAGLAHLWFITLHPFDDGNGRVARALTDRALAQAEQTSVRFYSLSAAIEADRSGYYDILEQTQAGETLLQQQDVMDVTAWLHWFLESLSQALEDGLQRVERVKNKAQFWHLNRQTVLTERHVKVLNRLLDSTGKEFWQGIAARQYQGIAGVSKATATRDLAELVEKKCLKKLPAEGRNTRYVLNFELGVTE